MKSEAWGGVVLSRRQFLKWSGAGLASIRLASRPLFSFPHPAGISSLSPSLSRDQLFDESYPFPFDDQYFACAERIFNVQPVETGWRAGLNLILKPGRTLDLKILTADSRAGLSTAKDVMTFYGVYDRLETDLFASDVPRLYYQVLYREGGGQWKALAPKSVKLPQPLDKGGEIKVIFIGDDHTFDDADYQVSADMKAAKLNGDYVNLLLRELRTTPQLKLQTPFEVLRNGLCLAHAVRYIMAHEDPDVIIHLGDSTGIGANYKWAGLGLPTTGLTEKEYNEIARVLWLRMRKMYSGLTPYVPLLIAQGNHDGEENWTSARFRACEWRKVLFPQPDDRTFPEGGHPDGLYYGFSLGGDKSNRGGARFIILHTTAFAGERYPRTPEEWTLGEAQFRWFERVLKMGERDWVFACFHHVLGGWPTGSNEFEKSYSYGRGPLFTFEDYLGCANPALVEQVRLTELGREHGLRAFFYGHDHIFHAKQIVSSAEGREMLGVCCGATKYMGEAGWWNGEYWRRYYGPAEPPVSRFWGPSGMTRLTIRRSEALIEYIVSGFTPYTNIPATFGQGTILAVRRMTALPPKIAVEQQELLFRATEGRGGPPPQTLRIKNAGGGALHYSLRADKFWINVSPKQGESWGEWKDITVKALTRPLLEGSYQGKIFVTSDDPAGSSVEVAVRLTVDPFVNYPPRNFRGWKTGGFLGTSAEVDIQLAWSANPLNKAVAGYRIWQVDASGKFIKLGDVDAFTFSYLVPKMIRTQSYRFAVAAVDRKGREGEPAYTTVA